MNQTQIASTNGWDTIYAVKFPAVNKAIVSQKSSPENFSNAMDDPDMGTTRLSGDFGDWQICMGGDGKNIRMNIPIASSALIFLERENIYTEFIQATIELNLLWVSGQETATTDPAHKNLKIDPANTVSVIMLDTGANKISETQKSIYRSLLENWLKSNVQEFQHVFAVIELNKQNAEGGFQWIMPTDTLYAVIDVNDSLEDSIFGVLCMTENRTSPGVHMISPYAIPSGCPSGFLISPERLLFNMILPGVKLLFSNATDADFKVTENGRGITNNTDLVFLDQQLDNGDWIRPKIDKEKFTLSVQDTYLEMEFSDLHFNYPFPIPFLHGGMWVPDMPGISVHMMYNAQSTVQMTTDHHFKVDMTKSSSSMSIQTETWLTVTEIVAGIVLSVGGALAGGFIGAALKAGTTTASAVTTAAIEGIEVTATETPIIATTNITPIALTESGAEVATNLSRVSTLGGKFATFFARNWAKLLGGMVGAGIGGSIASIPQILKAIANSNGSDEYNLAQFGTEALAPLSWPDQGPVELQSGILNGAFQMGFVLKTSNPSM